MAVVVPPIDDPDDRFFWEGARRHQLLLQRCATCGTVRHPPAPICAACHSTDWGTVASPGRGTVQSWILSHHPTDPDDEPRIVVLVELEGGHRVVSNLIDTAVDDVRHDMAVQVCFVDHGDLVLPQFRRARRDGDRGAPTPAGP